MTAQRNTSPFAGSLSDLSVIDVLQALRISRKSGALLLRGEGREAALTMEQGRVTSCHHPTPGVDVGHLLVESGVARPGDIELAAHRQANAGLARKPLVGTLVEMGLLTQKEGWKALERLVDSTVAEVCAWPSGTFRFEPGGRTSVDEFRHSPRAAPPELADSTQVMLSNALEILDERASPAPRPDGRAGGARPAIGGHGAWKVLVAGREALWRTGLGSGAGSEDFEFFVSENRQDLLARLSEWRDCGHVPSLLVDLGAGPDPRERVAGLDLLAATRALCPEVAIVVACDPIPSLCSEAFRAGAHATVPRPGGSAGRGEDVGGCCQVARDALATCRRHCTTAAEKLRQVGAGMRTLRDCVRGIRFPEGAADVSLVLLRHLAAMAERCVLFLVREHDLLALGAFGLDEDEAKTASALARLRLPLVSNHLFETAVTEGATHYGPAAGAADLHALIGAPTSPEVIILPLRTRERTVALLYGDFGQQSARAVDTAALEIAAEFAGMAFDLAAHERAAAAPRADIPESDGWSEEKTEPGRKRRPSVDESDLPVPVCRDADGCPQSHGPRTDD